MEGCLLETDELIVRGPMRLKIPFRDIRELRARLFRRFFAPGSLEAHDVAPSPHAGTMWMIRPKGRREITDGDVISAARAAALVDVKVVRFSETHSAEKFVIPKDKR